MDSLTIIFFIFATIAVGGALMTVLNKSPVGSAFSLILVFFCFAGIYAIMNAHLLAALQILLYTGAIMVLFVFVIMLLNADTPTFDFGRASPLFKGLASLSMLGLVGICSHVFMVAGKTGVWADELAQGRHTADAIAAVGGNTKAISQLLFSEYLLPFELVSILLLAAIVAAVAIAKRHSRPAPVDGRGK